MCWCALWCLASASKNMGRNLQEAKESEPLGRWNAFWREKGGELVSFSGA